MWDDVSEGPRTPSNPIPELLDSELVRFLPEFKNLENYGGDTYEANMQLAIARAKLLQNKFKYARNSIRANHDTALGLGYEIELDELTLGAAPDPISVRGLIDLVSNTDIKRALGAYVASTDGLFLTSKQVSDIGFFIDFLRNDNVNKTLDQLVAERLKRGVAYTPKVMGTSVVGSVSVPFNIDVTTGTTSMPSTSWAIDMDEYKVGLAKLDQFSNMTSMPGDVDRNSVAVKILATQEDFSSAYNAIALTPRDDLNRTQGVNFVLNSATSRELGAGIARNISGFGSLVLINHELNSNLTPEFGEGSAAAETLFHEIAHTYHHSMGLDWGAPGSENPKSEKYDSVKAESVSRYGDNDAREHFAESLAKYISTEQASQEFLDYLKDVVGVTDLRDQLPPDFFYGDNFKDIYVDYINSQLQGSGLTFTMSTQDATLANEAAAIQRISQGRGMSATVSVNGQFYEGRTPVGNINRVLTIDVDGKIKVKHDYFALDESVQGTGLGGKITRGLDGLYRDLGVSEVRVNAALSNGPYMWAMHGFEFENSSARELRQRNVATMWLPIMKELGNNKAKYAGKTPEEIKALFPTDLKNSASLYSYKNSNSGRDQWPSDVTLMSILQQADRFGWDIDNNLINELQSIADAQGSELTANMIARVGQANRRTKDKTTSSVGRMIMMSSGSWNGVKKL